MMGLQIAITGVVIFVFCAFMAHLARTEPKQPGLFAVFGLTMLAGFAAIPIGLIIQIWH